MSYLTFASFDPPQNPSDQPSIVQSTPRFSDILDDREETCHDFSDTEFLNLVFTFLSLDSGINHFRFLMNASQDCEAKNFLWFVTGELLDAKPSECDVKQVTSDDKKLCEIMCYCACAAECSYVHLQVQQLPWKDNQLSICHWEQVLTGQVVEPEVVKWTNKKVIIINGYWPFVRGIQRSPVNSPHKGQWRGALMFSLICVWINGWINNREAGDWRRYRAHYDVIVMLICVLYR